MIELLCATMKGEKCRHERKTTLLAAVGSIPFILDTGADESGVYERWSAASRTSNSVGTCS
jgi:hypothetical protein